MLYFIVYPSHFLVESDSFNLLLSAMQAWLSSVGLQDWLEWLRQDLVADLGVGNGPMLLAQVKAQLALVAEVKVALFALVRHEGQEVRSTVTPQAGRHNVLAERS